MSDEQNLGRQERKKTLKRNIVPEMTSQQVEDLEESFHRRQMRLAVRVIAGCALLVLMILGARVISVAQTFRKAETVWTEKNESSENTSYQVFGDRILKITDDGLAALDQDSGVIWNYGYTMKSPRVILNGEYGAVADIQSQTAVIFNKDGVTGEVSTTQPILGSSVSSHGVLVLELDNTDATYINFYDHSGKTLDIRIKTKLSGEGFPMDISLSPKGTGLMTSAVCLDQGSMKNQVIFYNFDVGKSDSNRVVGRFSYGENFFPEVKYFTDTRAAAFGDDQINIYSLRNESKPALLKSIPFEARILSVFSSDERIGVITAEGETGKKLQVYDIEGRRRFSKEFSFNYQKVEFSGDYVVMTNGAECLILSGGNIKFSGSLTEPIRKLVMTGTDSCLLFTDSAVKKIRFK